MLGSWIPTQRTICIQQMQVYTAYGTCGSTWHGLLHPPLTQAGTGSGWLNMLLLKSRAPMHDDHLRASAGMSCARRTQCSLSSNLLHHPSPAKLTPQFSCMTTICLICALPERWSSSSLHPNGMRPSPSRPFSVLLGGQEGQWQAAQQIAAVSAASFSLEYISR